MNTMSETPQSKQDCIRELANEYHNDGLRTIMLWESFSPFERAQFIRVLAEIAGIAQ